jgi:hypothetical protein
MSNRPHDAIQSLDKQAPGLLRLRHARLVFLIWVHNRSWYSRYPGQRVNLRIAGYQNYQEDPWKLETLAPTFTRSVLTIERIRPFLGIAILESTSPILSTI